MNMFLEPLTEWKAFRDIQDKVAQEETPLQITGCQDSQKCHFMYGLGLPYTCKVIVTYNDIRARQIYEDYKLFDRNVLYYPAKDVIFYNADVRGNAITRQRMQVLKALLLEEEMTVVTTIDGGMDFVLEASRIAAASIELTAGEEASLEQIQSKLVAAGYQRQAQVAEPGEFSLRGGILDVYPLTEECPVRVEFWGDEIDTIRSFDVESQRSIETLDAIRILPATEVMLSPGRLARGVKKIRQEKEETVKRLRAEGRTEAAGRLEQVVAELCDALSYRVSTVGVESYISYFYESTGSFFDYFNRENSIFFLDEPGRCYERMEAVELEFRESMMSRLEQGYILPGQMEVIYGQVALFGMLSRKRLVLFSGLDAPVRGMDVVDTVNIRVQGIASYNNHFEMLVSDLKEYSKKKYRVVFLCNSTTRAKRLCEDFRDNDVTAVYRGDFSGELPAGQVVVAGGTLHQGFAYPAGKFVVITEGDVFAGEKKKRRRRKKYSGKAIQSFNELNVGDYVVHENHGIGIYRGIEKIEVDKVAKDYVKIEYAAGGNLYVLATGVDVLQKYAGSDAKKPKLHKLNSIEWKNTKTKVKGAVKEIARELVELYAARQQREGHAFEKDTVWQKEFEELFPYEETQDQLMAIDATKKDMESNRIMDRLICGDVGYGKTEIAIRAAFKAVTDNMQVAVLVPTTILAKQHYDTFCQRMKDFPITVRMLSRFNTKTEQKKTIEDLKKGQVDIVIGTHRLLSADVGFRSLGLLVIDEEQRFGVAHKEKIKQMRGDVDVIALSATPIPRTLHMSLVGIRDMSVLEEPPMDRLPIQTFVMEHNGEMIREAINRELSRGGQVYYVYNRVKGIDRITAEVKELVPEANVAFAHGQMSERELEKIMMRFIEGEIQVLVATTIIETGLDISNVNTMIIDDADRLGLSQLYQLRGRVGRADRTAYAFLMYKRDKMLKETAEKRLQAIKEFTELGSGFKVAMRDLEIRGAGNLLGAAQSGHMESVGYDLYCKLLNDAVLRMKGEQLPEEEFETSVDLDVDAFIPATYIKSELQKLDMYKRISNIGDKEELMDIQDELIDRFGDIPPAAQNLLSIALIKAMAHRAFVTQIKQLPVGIRIYMYPKGEIRTENIPALIEMYGGDLKFVPDAVPYFLYNKNERKSSAGAGKSAGREKLRPGGTLPLSGAGTAGGIKGRAAGEALLDTMLELMEHMEQNLGARLEENVKA